MSIREQFIKSIELKLMVATSPHLVRLIEAAAQHLVRALKRGNQILIAGNGGSAADAQHFAAELSGKFLNVNRRPLPAISLTTNTSNLTAIGNDFGYEYIFSRQLRAQGRPGDVFVGISTSGNSTNILHALEAARSNHLLSICLLGNAGGKASALANLSITVPSDNTQNIQEVHITIIHILCGIIDGAMA